MKNVIIYHASCTDGFGAAFCAWQLLRDEAIYIPMHYGKVKNVADMNSVLAENGIASPCKDTKLFVMDFSFDKDIMEWLFTEFGKVVWLDHHKTAFESWCGSYTRGMTYSTVHHPDYDDVYIVLDDNKSGAMLAWEHFNVENAPDFIKFIDDRDRWQFKCEESKLFHAGMAMRKNWTFEQWDNIFSDFTDLGMTEVLHDGEVVLKAYDQQIESLVKYARKVVIDVPIFVHEDECHDHEYYEGLAVNSPIHMSEIGHELANASGTFGLIWYLGEDNNVKISLRSNGDYDVSAICKQFGGGGHKNASGCSVPVEQFLKWLK